MLQDEIADYLPKNEFIMGSLLHLEQSVPEHYSIFDIFFDIPSQKWQSWRSVFLYCKESRA